MVNSAYISLYSDSSQIADSLAVTTQKFWKAWRPLGCSHCFSECKVAPFRKAPVALGTSQQFCQFAMSQLAFAHPKISPQKQSNCTAPSSFAYIHESALHILVYFVQRFLTASNYQILGIYETYQEQLQFITTLRWSSRATGIETVFSTGEPPSLMKLRL